MVGLLHKYRAPLLAGLFGAILFVLTTSIAYAGIKADIYNGAVNIGGLFTGMGGTALDSAIHQLVIEMGERMRGPFGGAIGELWSLARDFFNLLFIFGLIFIGIKTILNSEDAGTQRLLGKLILAALLINFSLLITSAIIDFSNVTAGEIYRYLTAQTENSSGIDVGAGDDETQNIHLDDGTASARFMNITNISSLLEAPNDSLCWLEPETTADGVEREVKNCPGLGKVLALSIFVIIFLFLAGMIFLWGALLIVTRFVALSIYMILSPVMFLGWVMPNLQRYTSQWWQGFLKQAFFAPAFFFMLLIAFQTLSVLTSELTAQGQSTSLLAPFHSDAVTSNSLGVFLVFIVSLGFLIASIKVGQMMGVSGAGFAMKTMSGMGRGMRRGVSGFAYRNTGGLLFKGYAAASQKLHSASQKEGRGLAGRIGLTMARGAMGGEAAYKGAVKASNWGAGGAGLADKAKQREEMRSRASRDNALTKIKQKQKEAEQAKGTPQEEEARIAFEEAMSDASNSQIIDLLKKDSSRVWTSEFLPKIASKLTEAQFKAIMDSDVPDALKNKIAGERSSQLENDLIERANRLRGENDPEIEQLSQIIHKLDAKELNALGYEKILKQDLESFLTSKQIEDWKDLTPTQKDRLKQNRKEDLVNRYDGSYASRQQMFEQISTAAERAKLPKEILTRKETAEFIDTNVLAKILDNDSLSTADLTKIKENVRAYYGNLGNIDKYRKLEKWFETPQGQRY